MNAGPAIYFSDIFGVTEQALEDYGALNMSLVADLPLFIDPFLLFGSEKTEYQELHQSILAYITYLRDQAAVGELDDGRIRHLFHFPEVKQTWLGFSKTGNSGNGLGKTFAEAMLQNIQGFFSESEKVYQSEHLEKLCIVKSGVGKDNISDFTTNLIHGYLLEYTQTFASEYIDPNLRNKVSVSKAVFNYELGRWMPRTYDLPWLGDDYALLTPKDMLTKEDTWINQGDMLTLFPEIAASIPNAELRASLNAHFKRHLPPRIRGKKQKPPTAREVNAAKFSAIQAHLEFLDYFIKYKEDHQDEAKSLAESRVEATEELFIQQVRQFTNLLGEESAFYTEPSDTYLSALHRAQYLKQVIENNDGYRLFYVKGKPIERETDLQIMYRLTWFGTRHDVNTEVNNGRGPVDFKISTGKVNASLVEMKLASNSQLKKNLENQVAVYAKANETQKHIKVILYFSVSELNKTQKILRELKIDKLENVILIDARKDNKPSASKAKTH